MADISLLLTVDAKTGAATLQQVAKGLDDVDAKGKKAQAGLSGLSGTLSSLARNVLGAVSVMGALKLAFDSLKAQDEAMKAANSLNLALANQGNLLPGVSARLLEYNDALQQKTAFEGDAITAAQATLASFGMNEEAIKRTTKAALDFSAATGKDLPNVMELLGKAYAGNTSALGKYGIVIDESVPKSQRFEAALGQLEQRFHGFAEAQAGTFSGGLAQAKNALGDAQEALGKFLGELLGSDKPFGLAVSGAQWLARVLGHDLVIALGEARARFAETQAGILRDAAGFSEKVAGSSVLQGALNALGTTTGLPLGSIVAGVGRESAKDLRDFAAGLDQAAAAIRTESDAAAASAGKTLAFSNGVKQASKDSLEAAAAFKKAAGYVIDGVDLFEKGGYVEQKAFAELQAFALDAAHKAAEAMQGPQELSARTIAMLREGDGEVLKLGKDWSESLRGVADAFLGIGNIAQTVLGKIVSGMASAVQMAKGLFQALQGHDWGGVAAAGLNFIGSSVGKGAGAGALGGAAFGATLGSVMPGIGTVLGGIGGALIGGIAGLFGGKKAEKLIPPTWEEKFKAALASVEQFGIGAGKAIGALLGTPGNRRPEAQAYINQQLSQSATGAGGFIGQGSLGSQASAAGQAAILGDTFRGLMAEQGLLAAVDQLKEPFNRLRAQIEEQFGPDLAKQLLGGIGGYFSAMDNEAVRPAMERISAADQALKGLALSQYLTKDSMAGFGQVAQDSYNQVLAGLQETLPQQEAQNQALQSVAPLLADIVKAHDTYGLAIDANTQALIDQARAAGIAFPVDPMTRLVDKMDLFITKLSQAFHLSEDLGGSLNGLNIPGSGGGPRPQGYGEGYAGGFSSLSMPWGPLPGGGTPVVLHPREQVSVIPAGRRSSGGGTTVNVPISVAAGGGVDRAAFQRELAEEIRREKVPELMDRITERVRLRLRVA